MTLGDFLLSHGFTAQETTTKVRVHGKPRKQKTTKWIKEGRVYTGAEAQALAFLLLDGRGSPTVDEQQTRNKEVK